MLRCRGMHACMVLYHWVANVRHEQSIAGVLAPGETDCVECRFGFREVVLSFRAIRQSVVGEVLDVGH